jgi:anti-sigma-K factor RskA
VTERQGEQSQCGGDVAAYVLGALEPDEARALQEHIATCAVCRDELVSLQGVADALPLATPQLALPRRLERQVKSAIRADARSRYSSRRFPVTRPRGVLAGALAIAAAAAIAAVLASGGSSATRVVQASVAPSGTSAVLRLGAGQAALVVRHMPAPPSGKIYEVWLERSSGPPRPTDALFGVTSSGSAAVAVPGNLRGVRAVLVTPEPAGGSAAPTHAPVIVAQL